VDTVEIKDFDEAAFDRSSPLLIKGAAARAVQKWTDEWLHERLKGQLCQVSRDSRPSLTQFKTKVQFNHYLKGLENASTADYLFDSQRDFDGVSDLLTDLDVPPAISRLGDATMYRLFVGPALSGTLPHYHTYAINALARGRKRWAIYVGRHRRHTTQLLRDSYRRYGAGCQAKDWFIQECPNLRSRPNVRIWEFVQNAGDLVYIPRLFIHAIINTEPVVGITVEFTDFWGDNSGGFFASQPGTVGPRLNTEGTHLHGLARKSVRLSR
jgi:hypothetical protein